MPQSALGSVIRHARRQLGWTQEDLGRRIGYTKTRISRAETGVQPIRDVTVLKRLAEVLGLRLSLLGVADQAPMLANKAGHVPLREGPVDRRAFLGNAGVLGVCAGVPAGAVSTAGASDPAHVLEQRLTPIFFTSSAGPVVSTQDLRDGLSRADAAFHSCSYLRLADLLPSLITSMETAHSERPTPDVAAVASASYYLAARAVAKLKVSGLQPLAAERAVGYAQRAKNPAMLAERHAPQEVHTRHTARRLITTLRGNNLPGLANLAVRAHAD